VPALNEGDTCGTGTRWPLPFFILRPPVGRVLWPGEPGTGKPRDLTLKVHRRFWGWDANEALRHFCIGIEQLTELSPRNVDQYRMVGAGELMPLLRMAPHETDAKRFSLVSPELTRSATGAAPEE
jgi:hypothetical protein